MNSEQESLYELLGTTPTQEPGRPKPFPPGTTLTASVETVDNDCAALLLSVGALS